MQHPAAAATHEKRPVGARIVFLVRVPSSDPFFLPQRRRRRRLLFIIWTPRVHAAAFSNWILLGIVFGLRLRNTLAAFSPELANILVAKLI